MELGTARQEGGSAHQGGMRPDLSSVDDLETSIQNIRKYSPSLEDLTGDDESGPSEKGLKASLEEGSGRPWRNMRGRPPRHSGTRPDLVIGAAD